MTETEIETAAPAVTPVTPRLAHSELGQVTRSAKVWSNSPRNNLVMTIPKDVSELTGIGVGDTVLVTGMADGRITVVRADNA